MRITEKSMAFNFLHDVHRSRERIVKMQEALASGKKVSRPSDNPQAADTILRLQGSIARLKQYESNVVDGQGMVENTESALNAFTNVLIRLKEIVTRANSGGNADLDVYANQIDGLLSEGVDIANTRFNGKYLFGGTQTLDPPFLLAPDRSVVTPNPNGVTGRIEYEIGEGIRQAVNIDGLEAFDGGRFFDEIILIRNTLQSGNFPTPLQVDSVSKMLDHVAGKAGKAGTIMQHLMGAEQSLADRQLTLMSLLSQQQDTDIAEAATTLKYNEVMLEAALNIGGRVIPKTLLDFLR